MTFINLVSIISFFMILQSLWHLVRTSYVVKKVNKQSMLKSEEGKNKNGEEVDFFFVIPCFEEKNTIESTIDYFVELIKKSSSNIKLIIVTTNKEIGNRTTYDVVKKKISSSNVYSNTELINYPKNKGMMADQLNYAMENIQELYNFNKNKTYFCVYNADSRPGSEIILEAEKKVHNDQFPKIMQEYSAFLTNLYSLSPIMKGMAVYQTNFELTNGFTNAVLPSVLLRNHVVGHGLFIRYDFLEKLGGFTNKYWCEDIYLSFILRSTKVKIVPLYSLEYGEAPKNLRVLTKQNANWFKTLSDTYLIYKDIKKGEKYNSNSTRLYLANQIRGAIAWLILPTIYIGILCSALLKREYVCFIVFLAIYFVTTSIRFLMTLRIVECLSKTKLKNKLLLSFEASVAYFISNIGPLYSLMNKKATKYKTER